MRGEEGGGLGHHHPFKRGEEAGGLGPPPHPPRSGPSLLTMSHLCGQRWLIGKREGQRLRVQWGGHRLNIISQDPHCLATTRRWRGETDWTTLADDNQLVVQWGAVNAASI